jgi:hypothetical protein
MMDTKDSLVCTDSVSCPLSVAEHGEDADCPKVACTPPQCQHGTDLVSCRECAASPPEGWELIECTKGHPVMWMPDDQWSYSPPCPYCSFDDLQARHAGCEHAQHGRWRRWRVTHRLVGWAYVLGLVTASACAWGDGCSHCLTMVRWRGRRPYILGLYRETWSCLRYGHRRVDVGGLCAVCAPCPDCGSQTAGHAEACQVGDTP